LVTANAGSGTVSVLRGSGGGYFVDKTDFGIGGAPISVAIGDLNADGKPDLAAANADYGSSGVSVLLGNGDGSFGAKADVGTAGTPIPVAIGDLDGDGELDLAPADSGFLANTVAVLLGNGDGSFGVKAEYGTGNHPYSVAIGDLNGDGKPDL